MAALSLGEGNILNFGELEEGNRVAVSRGKLRTHGIVARVGGQFALIKSFVHPELEHEELEASPEVSPPDRVVAAEDIRDGSTLITSLMPYILEDTEAPRHIEDGSVHASGQPSFPELL